MASDFRSFLPLRKSGAVFNQTSEIKEDFGSFAGRCQSFGGHLGYDGMHDSRIILFEKDGHWAIALRRELNGDAVRVFETRSPEDCLDAVAQRPTSFVAVELTGKNVDPVYRCVAEIRDQYPQARVVVLSCAELESLELEMREAGAVHIVYSPRQLATVARLVEKHVASIPAPKMNLRQSVLSRLPWRV